MLRRVTGFSVIELTGTHGLRANFDPSHLCLTINPRTSSGSVASKSCNLRQNEKDKPPMGCNETSVRINLWAEVSRRNCSRSDLRGCQDRTDSVAGRDCEITSSIAPRMVTDDKIPRVAVNHATGRDLKTDPRIVDELISFDAIIRTDRLQSVLRICG